MTTEEVLREFEPEFSQTQILDLPPANAEISHIDYKPMRGWIRLIPYDPKCGKPYNEKESMLAIFRSLACLIDEQHIPSIYPAM